MIDGAKLSKLLKIKSISSKDLSLLLDNLDIKLGIESIKKYRMGTVNIPSKTVTALAEILNVTEQELYVNADKQKIKITRDEIKKHPDNYSSLITVNTLPKNIKKISLLYGYVGAGSSGLVDDEALDEIYIDINLILSKYRNNDIFGIQIIGDSMLPYVSSQDIILYSLTSNDFNRTDGKYIINRNGDLMLKNVQFCINGDIIISSENKAYKNETISKGSEELENFKVIGRVAGRILKG